MKKIVYLIRQKRPMQVRLLALFLLLIYLPILFNVFFIQRQTVSTVREDKLLSIEESLNRTAGSMDGTLRDIERLLENRTQQPGIQKGVEDYPQLPEQAQESFHLFMDRQLTDIENTMPYLRHSRVFSLEGDHFGPEEFWHEDFYDSSFYQDLLAETLTEGWYFLPSQEVYQPVYFDELYSGEEATETLLYVESLSSLEGNSLVGYMVAIVDEEIFSELYQNVYIGEEGRLALWTAQTPETETTGDLSAPLRQRILEAEDFVTAEVDNETMLFYSVPLDSFPGTLSARIPEASFTRSIEEPLRLNLYLMILISTLISLWVLFEIIIISNMASEKESARYRLNLSEEVNEKLRMYKHDFANHLQVIQGLIHLGKSDRALKYLNTISDQGKMISESYEIGIPELEVVMQDAYQQGREQDIEVNIQTVKLPPSLSMDIYDLVKALTNVVKNAFEAMALYPERDRKLSITLYEKGPWYVFKISNNLPVIAEKHRSRIFEKGFSTKEKGDGFGLYMVQSLLEKHGGEVELIVDDNGNHFYLKIPKE